MASTHKGIHLLEAHTRLGSEKFKQFLESRKDLDTRQGTYPRDTYLTHACRDPKAEHVVLELLTAGADPRVTNGQDEPPIHIAAEKCNIKALSHLLQDSKTEVNQLDGHGNTALHALCKGEARPLEDAITCLKSLLLLPDLEANKPNRKGVTAAFFAAECGHRDIVEVLINSPNMDLDSAKTFDGITARRMIMKKFPDMKLPPKFYSNDNDVTKLFSTMHSKEIQSFESSLNECLKGKKKINLLNSDDGSWTLLQYAASRGITEIVKLLLEKGADPNKTLTKNEKLPSTFAASAGSYGSLALLLSHPTCKISTTVLHDLIQGYKCHGDKDGFKKCFRLLLKRSVDVNAVDGSGNTALHIAEGDENCVLELTAHGASMAIKNRFGSLPLENVTASTLHKCLDARLEQGGMGIQLDYRCLVQPKRNLHENEVLLYISGCPRLRHLIKHPVLSAFLALKWPGALQLLYFNLFYYFIFVASLTCYILLVYNFPIISGGAAFCQQWWLLLLSLSLVFKEIYKLVIEFKGYFTSAENYIDISLVLLTALVVLHQSADAQTRTHVSALSIFLSWSKFLLLTGRHTRLATYFEMLKAVSRSVLFYLSWSSLIICGFSIIFYILFRSDPNFKNPGLSLFKTLIMMTGEFDLGDDDKVPGTSHVLFILFVFLVAIVLLNLINGLAISDTQTIRNDAEFIAIISRVKVVSYTERCLLGRPFSCSSWKLSRISYVKKFIEETILVFPKMPAEKSIRLLPDGPQTPQAGPCLSNSNIYKEAKCVLNREPSDVEEIKRDLTAKLEDLKDTLYRYLYQHVSSSSTHISSA